MPSVGQMRSVHQRAVDHFGEDYMISRDGQDIRLRGLRSKDKRHIQLAHDSAVCIGDQLRSVASGEIYEITELDATSVGSNIAYYTAHYETPRQQAQRLAAERHQHSTVTIGAVIGSNMNVFSQLQNVSQAIATQPPTNAATKAEVDALLVQLDEAMGTAAELTSRLLRLVQTESG